MHRIARGGAIRLFTRLITMAMLCLECAVAFSQQTSEPRVSHIDPTVMDRQADPCVNFYQYACGNYQKLHPLKPDEDYVFLSDLTRPDPLAQMAAFLSGPAPSHLDSALRQLRVSYNACMTDGQQTVATGNALLPLLQEINRYQGPAELPLLLKDLLAVGSRPFFGVTVGFEPDVSATQILELTPPKLSLADGTTYRKVDDESRKSIAALREHIIKVFLALGEDVDSAKQQAGYVVTIETRLAAAEPTSVARRDPRAHIHPYSASQLRDSLPNFAWGQLLSALGVSQQSMLNVDNVEELRAFEELILTSPPSAIRAYLRYKLVISIPTVIAPIALAEEAKRYGQFGRDGGGLGLPRTQQCLLLVLNERRDDVIRAYIAQFLPKDLKLSADAMVSQIRLQLAHEIRSATWLNDKTRQSALDKLDNMSQVIVYGSLRGRYSGLPVFKREAMRNYLISNRLAFKQELASAGTPIDRQRGKFHPLATGAMYRGDANVIEVPGAEWLPPSFDLNADPAENYSRSGFTVGHELIHAFDDQGRKRDATGALIDWWTEMDSKRFQEKAACFVDEYEAFGTAPEHHENGQLTLGENIADNGGLHLALLAYLAYAKQHGVDPSKPEDGWTPLQRFFLSYAQDTCSAVRPDSELRQMQTNPHSLDRFRANGVLRNTPEFGKAFSCQENSPMAPSRRCEIW